MRRLFLELYNKNIFPPTPITSFSPFLSYIVVTPLILGFEKDFSCHSHLGPIRIPSLFSFPPAPFPRNDKEDGTLELSYLSAFCLPKILLLQLVGHRVIQISCVLCGFPMLQLPYQFGRSGMDRLNILLGSLVFTLLCGIHSRLALGITSSSGWNSSQNPTTSPTSLPPTVSRTSIETEWFHVLSSIGYSSPFVSLFPIAVSMSLQDWMALGPEVSWWIATSKMKWEAIQAPTLYAYQHHGYFNKSIEEEGEANFFGDVGCLPSRKRQKASRVVSQTP